MSLKGFSTAKTRGCTGSLQRLLASELADPSPMLMPPLKIAAGHDFRPHLGLPLDGRQQVLLRNVVLLLQRLRGKRMAGLQESC